VSELSAGLRWCFFIVVDEILGMGIVRSETAFSYERLLNGFLLDKIPTESNHSQLCLAIVYCSSSGEQR